MEIHFRAANQTIRKTGTMLRKFALRMVRQVKTRAASNRTAPKLMFDCLPQPHPLLRILFQTGALWPGFPLLPAKNGKKALTRPLIRDKM
ncbi:MAG: hypothetical protein LIO70_08115 [Clostridiales bacterium]|nr:hypothetical protein [Clostridiales bacterium]